MPRVDRDGHPRRIHAILLALLVLGQACQRPTRPTEPLVETPRDPAAAPSPADLEDLELDVIEGLADMGVRLLLAESCVEVDGRVNMDRGPVEVFACVPGGKTHESVVVLDCLPSGLHAGLLVLDMLPGHPFRVGPDGALQPPTGDGVRIEVRWTDAAGRSQVARAEDWIWNVAQERAMEPAAWIFAGSYLSPRRGEPGKTNYAADMTKSLVVTYHDASAILENPWPGADDTRYHANIHAVPEVGTPVTVRFTPDR